MVNFSLFSEPEKLYKQMLHDINNAKHSILLETYLYKKDSVGNEFRATLTKKAKQGVKVKLLIDTWGSGLNKNYFKELIRLGGEVLFFREFTFVWRIFAKNHERNHRKLLIIDNKLSYLGSANITHECLAWRELILRFEEREISKKLSTSFHRSWSFSKRFSKKILKDLFIGVLK